MDDAIILDDSILTLIAFVAAILISGAALGADWLIRRFADRRERRNWRRV